MSVSYHVGVCVLVPFDGARYLATSRRGRPNDVGFPGGKVEPGEPLRYAASRELWEETGILVDPWGLAPFYRAPNVSDDGREVWDTHLFIVSSTWCAVHPPLSLEPYAIEPGVLVQYASERDLCAPTSSFSRWNQTFFDAVNNTPFQVLHQGSWS